MYPAWLWFCRMYLHHFLLSGLGRCESCDSTRKKVARWAIGSQIAHSIRSTSPSDYFLANINILQIMGELYTIVPHDIPFRIAKIGCFIVSQDRGLRRCHSLIDTLHKYGHAGDNNRHHLGRASLEFLTLVHSTWFRRAWRNQLVLS